MRDGGPGGATLPFTVITPRRQGLGGTWRELWAFRTLFYFLVWRDLKVRYKQTVLGATWAVIQPLGTMVVFSIVFGRLAGMPSDGIPYPVFAYVALVPWTYFATAVAGGAQALVGSQPLIAKVYFPRLVLPLAAVTTPLVDAAIALLVLGALLAWFQMPLSWSLVALPGFAGLAVMAAAGVGVWLSALTAKYRDVRHVLPFLVQFWLFATPVAYPSSLVPDAWRAAYGLNPMASVVEGFRWALLGAPPPPAGMLVASVATVLAVIGTGAWYFRRTESQFADVL